MSAPDKPRYPREKALEVAQEIYDLLKPWCERIKVVGSLRRRKAWVSDCEILFIGKKLTRQKDLFENEAFDAALHRIDELEMTQVIRKRPNVNGHTAWGDKNRLAVHCKTGIPIDFFAATEENFWNLLVCRTGGAKMNTLISEAYQRRNRRWHPYEIGYSEQDGSMHPNFNERAVFTNAGLAYVEPWARP